MWTRAELKEKAKQVLTGNYWKAFLVSFVIAVVSGGGGGGGSAANGGGTGDAALDAAIIGIIAIIVIVVSVFGIAFSLFVSNPLIVGGTKYFIRSCEDEFNLSYLGFSFKKEKYLKIVGAMAYRQLLLFLWTLLLIIPGIVIGYAYRMVPYILADNPEIGYKRVLELSKEMTKGEKMNIFILDLSFIGWYLLGILACFIGVMFVRPYQDTTNAQLYHVLRRNAISSGICLASELNVAAADPFDNEKAIDVDFH